MANITINEISSNYQWNIGTTNFATVALPITACWGPAYMDINTMGITKEQMMEELAWQRFPSTQEGLESFVATYRGPASNYRLAKDFSYQMAMTLMTAGYDVLVCRLCPGTCAQASFTTDTGATFTVKAKYPGTFGNNLQVVLQKVANRNYWNIITYVIDSTGVRTAVENLLFVFDLANSTDSILHLDELDSKFLTFAVDQSIPDTATFTIDNVMLAGGTDKAADQPVATMMEEAITLATARYTAVGYTDQCDYVTALNVLAGSDPDEAKASTVRYNEWLYNGAIEAYELLKDKLSYNPQRIISPGWDDQNITDIDASRPTRLNELSPLHIALLDTAYYSRCGTALIDIPKCLPRSAVYNESTNDAEEGYAQMLGRYLPDNAVYDINSSLYSTHSALFAPWGQYTYSGTSKQNPAPPAFLALMIQRAMLLNQTIQYEWALPTNRQHNLTIGKLDYKVPHKLLNEWQSLEGIGVNVITVLPDLGTTLWGNSTLFEVPPATYQALSNLSTRYLVNAVEDTVYKCGINITFQYNNEQAYNEFYAGVSPLLDTMRNVGAIEDYYITMSADIDANDRINANTVIGKIYLVVYGVINDIVVDLIALPQGTDLDQYRN